MSIAGPSSQQLGLNSANGSSSQGTSTPLVIGGVVVALAATGTVAALCLSNKKNDGSKPRASLPPDRIVPSPAPPPTIQASHGGTRVQQAGSTPVAAEDEKKTAISKRPTSLRSDHIVRSPAPPPTIQASLDGSQIRRVDSTRMTTEDEKKRSEEGKRLVAFYEGHGRNSERQKLEEILQWTDAQLEDGHRQVQWLCPNWNRSGADPTAPRLSNEAITRFRERPELQRKISRVFDRWLRFYGFTHAGKGIVRDRSFHDRAEGTTEVSGWLAPRNENYNHNYYRMTRILNWLQCLGKQDEAMALFRCLEDMYRDPKYTNRISKKSFDLWHKAVGEPPHIV